MQPFDLRKHPHTRFNLLTGDSVLVSPHRMNRPWQGKIESLPMKDRPAYDPECYLCPGNIRADGDMNPPYTDSFVFVNDYSALLMGTPEGSFNIDDLLQASGERGICKVISFTPDHNLTLSELSVNGINKVVDVWCEEFESIAANPVIKYIQIFENKGEIMGCSNPHPHGQIWSQSSLPLEIVNETHQQKKYYMAKGRSLLSDYLQLELEQEERIVAENELFIALVPFWATWPFETMIVSRRHITSLNCFTSDEKFALADILKKVTVKYDNLFEISFPYSAGMHQSPVNDGAHPEWHWHMHFYPPLLRSASVKKFMVGYEMLANPQRDITPESAAEKLKSLSEVHYRNVPQ